MSNKLRPAVAASEWRVLREHPDRYQHMLELARSVGRHEAVLALGNDALPDSSDYKLTTADVAYLRRAADRLRSGTAQTPDYATSGDLLRLADKLAALLPLGAP